jgi:predicted GTPase
MSTAQPTETPTPITDEEVAKFLKEFDEGKHPLTDAEKDALATVGFRRQLQMSIELKRLRAFEQGALVRYDTYEKTVAALTTQLEEARRDSARLDGLEALCVDIFVDESPIERRNGMSLRQAIDAALTERKEKVE